MKDTTICLFKIDEALEKNSEYYRLQMLSDEDVGSDFLMARGSDEIHERWLQIAKGTELLAKSYDDGRLELLRYRADLRLGGIYFALGRLVSAHTALKGILESNIPLEQLRVGRESFEIACYFFSNSHLREFNSAFLHDSIKYTPTEIFQELQDKAPKAKNIAAANDSLQKIKTCLANSAKNNQNLFFRFREAKAFFSDLERWLRDNNALGITVNFSTIPNLLNQLEDLLLQYIAPPSKSISESKSYKPSLSSGEQNDIPPASNVVKKQTAPISKSISTLSDVIDQLTREEVIDLLKNLCQWYAMHEPGSPAPFFLQRAIRSMNSDFIGILKDILPDSVGAFEKIFGLGPQK